MTWNVVQSSSHDDSTPCTLDNTYNWMTNHSYFDIIGQELVEVLELLCIVLILVVQWHVMFSKQHNNTFWVLQLAFMTMC